MKTRTQQQEVERTSPLPYLLKRLGHGGAVASIVSRRQNQGDTLHS